MAVAAAALTSAGCMHEPVYKTLSGRPEVTIEGVPLPKVMETLVQLSRENGETVKNLTSDSFYTEIQLGRSHTVKFSHRDYDFKQSMNTVRVICSMKIVTMFDSGGYEMTDITPHAGGPQCMETLNKLKQALK